MTSILLIEDTSVLRESLQAVLTASGYECHAAADGHDGWRQFREYQPDLVVTDIYMPDKDGLEVILQMRKDRPDVPIIAMTGAESMQLSFNPLAVANKFGANVCIQKPFSVAELISHIQDLLGE